MESTDFARLRVELGTRSYQVLVGSGLLDRTGALVREIRAAGRCAVVTDSNVQPFYGERVLQSLRGAGFEPTLVVVPAGEASKSMAQAEAICEAMIASCLDRSAFVVALGGGVIGDLAGFAAAIHCRGIPYVQVPTTIVSQVDSAVGGKTGVNARSGKNLIGAFHQPSLVIADIDTLRTLPAREFNEGFAEIIKHAVIRDAALLDRIAELDRADLAPIICRNVEIKAAIVSADEQERSGLRALLNYGHTIGHGIENAAGYGRYLHGEAISLGIVAASRVSTRKAGLAAADYDRILARLRQFHLPVALPADIPTDTIMAALLTDKKFAAGEVRFVLCPRIGDAFVSKDVTLEDIRAAIDDLR